MGKCCFALWVDLVLSSSDLSGCSSMAGFEVMVFFSGTETVSYRWRERKKKKKRDGRTRDVSA